MVESPAITTAQMWTVASVAALIDVILAAVLARRVRTPWPLRLAGTLFVVGTVGFAVLFTWAFRSYWDSCYGFALPALMRSLAPLLGAALGSLGIVWWLLARRFGRAAVPVFLVLGGIESIPGHVNAIIRFDLLERCPLLQGVSGTSALVFGFFEFGFYWSVVFTVAVLLARRSSRRHPDA